MAEDLDKPKLTSVLHNRANISNRSVDSLMRPRILSYWIRILVKQCTCLHLMWVAAADLTIGQETSNRVKQDLKHALTCCKGLW